MDAAKTWTSILSFGNIGSPFGDGLIGCSANGIVVLFRDEDASNGAAKCLLSTNFGTKWSALEMNQATRNFLEMSRIKMSKNS